MAGGAGLRCCSSPAEASLRGANHGRREESIGAKVKPKVKLGPRRSSGGGVRGTQGGDPRRRRTNPTPPLTSLEPASPPAEFTIARGRRSGPLPVRTRSTPTEISLEQLVWSRLGPWKAAPASRPGREGSWSSRHSLPSEDRIRISF